MSNSLRLWGQRLGSLRNPLLLLILERGNALLWKLTVPKLLVDSRNDWMLSLPCRKEGERRWSVNNFRSPKSSLRLSLSRICHRERRAHPLLERWSQSFWILRLIQSQMPSRSCAGELIWLQLGYSFLPKEIYSEYPKKLFWISMKSSSCSRQAP